MRFGGSGKQTDGHYLGKVLVKGNLYWTMPLEVLDKRQRRDRLHRQSCCDEIMGAAVIRATGIE